MLLGHVKSPDCKIMEGVSGFLFTLWGIKDKGPGSPL